MKVGDKVTEKDVRKATERVSTAIFNLEAARRAVERATKEVKDSHTELANLKMSLKYNNGILG